MPALAIDQTCEATMLGMFFRWQATILFCLLVIYAATFPVMGIGGLLEFSFFDPELMVNSTLTGGFTSEAMRWQHFLVWMPANLFGISACLFGVYATYLAQRGNFFTARFAKALMYLGGAVFLSAVADIIAASVIPHILSSLNPAGRIPITLEFSPKELGLILCGVGFVALGQLMAEATRLSDENKGFI